MDGNNPTAKFYNIKNIKPNVHEYITFGCPVHVLNSKLQLGSIYPPKWEPSSRVSIYLGHSPMYAGSLAIILNMATGNVSSQYHVVYDKKFSTVSYMRDETIPPTWSKMGKKSVESSTSNAFNLAELWFKHLTNTLEDLVTDPFAAYAGGRTLTSEGADNEHNLTKNSEGVNKVAIDVIAGKSLPILASITGRKEVSYADVQSGITKPSFLPKNKGDHMKMHKLVNL